MKILAIAILLGIVGCAARTDLPSYDEKAAIVRGYYSHVSGKEFAEALGDLTAGSFASADALSDRYCAVQTIGATDVSDIPGTAAVKVTVVGYARDGSPTTYTGKLDFSRDATSNDWRMNAPNLARNPDDPQLVGRSCAVAAATASPAPSSLDLADAGSNVSFSFEGTDSANRMKLALDNETDKVWTVKIKKGLRLESDDSSVQRMVVTQEYEIELEPHEKEAPKTINVACLDIGRAPPPSARSLIWTVADSDVLARFIDCTHAAPDSSELQPAIWLARGASRDDFKALSHYAGENVPPVVADAVATKLMNQGRPAAGRCGSLETL